MNIVDIPRIYLAGPEVFLPAAAVVGREKCKLLEQQGLLGVFPADTPVPAAGLTPAQHGLRIGSVNLGLINSCHGMIANLTPFRGPSADPGTVFEVGYALGRGLPVIGYSLDGRDYAQRLALDDAGRDRQGLTVEHFGLSDNLMLEAGLQAAGGALVRGPLRDRAELHDWQDMALFKQAVALYCQRFS